MKMNIENLDLDKYILFGTIQVLQELAFKEDRNFDDVKRIKNILDDLDNLNITITIDDIGMVKYTMLLSIGNISIDVVEKDKLEFLNLQFKQEELTHEYTRLINQYKLIHEKLSEFMTDDLLEYLQPNSKIINIRVSLSIKELINFILTCSKYDELIDINVLISEYDELMEKIVTLAMSLNDVLMVDDLFMRVHLDNEARASLLETGREMNIKILSNEEYIYKCMDELKADVKLSTIGTCSLVAYRELVNNVPAHSVKIENFFDLINGDIISRILPIEYSDIDPYIMNIIDGYIYDWFILSDKIKNYEYSGIDIMLTYLGCYSNIFKMNTIIEKYFLLMNYTTLSEVEDMMSVLEQKLLNKEC